MTWTQFVCWLRGGHTMHRKSENGRVYYRCAFCPKQTPGILQGNLDLPPIKALQAQKVALKPGKRRRGVVAVGRFK